MPTRGFSVAVLRTSRSDQPGSRLKLHIFGNIVNRSIDMGVDQLWLLKLVRKCSVSGRPVRRRAQLCVSACNFGSDSRSVQAG